VSRRRQLLWSGQTWWWITSWSFPTTQNSLLLFPSWLKHHVPPASASRESIAFNLMVTGFVGWEAERQSAEFS